jgi:hypothetical protein
VILTGKATLDSLIRGERWRQTDSTDSGAQNGRFVAGSGLFFWCIQGPLMAALCPPATGGRRPVAATRGTSTARTVLRSSSAIHTGVVRCAPASSATERETCHCGHRHFSSRIHGVKVIPTSKPSGPMKRLTVWPHGSLLFLTSIRYPRDSSSSVAASTLSTSNSIQACGIGTSRGHESVPKHY